MYSWSFGKPLEREISLLNAFPVIVGSLELSQLLLEKLHTEDEHLGILSVVHVAHTQCFWSDIQNRECSPLKYDTRGEFLFGEIVEDILPECDKELVMFVRILSVQFFDDHYNA